MTIETIEKVLGELNALKCKTEKEVEEARVRFLGKKGVITALFEEFRAVDGEQKRAFGRPLNELKQAALARIEELRAGAQASGSAEGSGNDLSLPGEQFELAQGAGRHLPEDSPRQGHGRSVAVLPSKSES